MGHQFQLKLENKKRDRFMDVCLCSRFACFWRGWLSETIFCEIGDGRFEPGLHGSYFFSRIHEANWTYTCSNCI